MPPSTPVPSNEAAAEDIAGSADVTRDEGAAGSPVEDVEAGQQAGTDVRPSNHNLIRRQEVAVPGNTPISPSGGLSPISPQIPHNDYHPGIEISEPRRIPITLSGRAIRLGPVLEP